MELAGGITNLTVRVHRERDGDLWAEVLELPGCFASGVDQAELDEALREAIALYSSTEAQQTAVLAIDWGPMREVETVDEAKIELTAC